MRWLERAWEGLRAAYLFVKPIRFAIVPLALLLWALIGSDQGQDAIRSLVELDPRCPRFGRIALFLAVTSLTALQAWYWSRQLLRIDRVAAAAASYPKSEKWIPRALGASVFLIALGALARAAFLAWSGALDYTGRVILGACAVLVLLLAGFLAAVAFRRRRFGAYARVATHRELDPATLAILRATAVLGALFVLWTAVSPLSAGRWFQSPALLMLAALLWVGLGSFLAYLFDSRRVPLATTFVFLTVAFSGWNDNHAVRTLAGALPARQPVDRTFAAWYSRLAAKYPHEPSHPVFVVATEGGGIRAAYWTAAVLGALEDRAPQFSDHLFAISGVSGGSLGGAVFTALVADGARTGVVDSCHGEVPDRSYRRAAQQILAYDFLAPTLASMLHADFVQRFLPVGFIPDRGRALETGWENAWRTGLTAAGGRDELFSGGMLRMYAERPNALLPSLFLNGTSVEAGNRLIASNCDLTDGQIPDAADLFARLGRDMRLSTAAHNSARFTYVSPAGAVHAKGGRLREHVVDGGYFENSGAATAADVIARLRLPAAGGPPFTVHLILVKLEAVEAEGCTPTPMPSPGPERFMGEVLSPLRALVATRGARGTLAYAEAGELPQVTSHPFILTENRRGLRMPLGWLLSERTRNAIDAEVGPEVPQGLDCALVPAVRKNRDQLLAIARLLNPAPRAVPDPVQHEAAAGERAARQ